MSNLVDVLKIGTQSAVHANDFFINDSTDWKTVETIGECLPEFDVVSAFAFFIKPVNAVD